MEKFEEKDIETEKGEKLWDCLYRGDPRVCVLLGTQKAPGPEEKIRRNRYAYYLYMDGKYLLFHLLTRELLAVSPQVIEYFADDRLFSVSLLEKELPAMLYEHHFLVPEDMSESQIYMELKDVLVLKEELPKGITHYVILPTTTCNARCFYCFEQGIKYHRMSARTVRDTIAFILQHKPAEQKKIHIHWFGGEPMCAADNIDRICEGLNDAGIEFTAEMTSNGSLFTEETARKATEQWKIGKIQITLDGMAEEYEKRKNYSKAVRKPFETVITNIHCLIGAGIGVTVRLNVDENNLGDIFRVIDYLSETFTAEEKKKLQVYAHSLFRQSTDGLDACPVGTGSDELETRVLEINDVIHRKGLMVLDIGPLFTLKSHYCMVTAPECNVLIDAAGRLFACDAMPESMCYGNVKDGIRPEAWKRVAEPCVIREECENCVFLPQCTEFDRCPNRMTYDSCVRQETRKLDRELRFVYAIWQERQKKKQQEAENPVKAQQKTRPGKKAEREDACDVSD